MLRVVNIGSCLNIRAKPDPAAPALECAADGVLLVQGIGAADGVLLVQGIGAAEAPGGVYDVGGVTWLSVIAPSGTEGWASSEYLER